MSGPDDEEPDGGAHNVGPGRPPMHSRWKPGQSGNKRGRPLGSKNKKTLFEKIASRMRKLTTPDGVVRRPSREIVYEKLFHKCAAGDVKAIAQWTKLEEKHGILSRTGEKVETSSGIVAIGYQPKSLEEGIAFAQWYDGWLQKEEEASKKKGEFPAVTIRKAPASSAPVDLREARAYGVRESPAPTPGRRRMADGSMR